MASNNFGATEADVPALYQGSAAEDFGGSSIIQAALDRYGEMVTECLSDRLWSSIRTPTAQLVVREATAGQTTWSLGLAPVVAGTVHLFKYAAWPRSLPQTQIGGTLGEAEIDPDDYTVTLSTGAVVYSGDSLNEGEMVFATYEVDVENAAFSMESLASKVTIGAGAELGAMIYVQPADPASGQGRWGLVKWYADQWREWCTKAKAGEWIPAEIRALDWWQAPTSGGTMGSVVIQRG